jgi:hypothetical protein
MAGSSALLLTVGEAGGSPPSSSLNLFLTPSGITAETSNGSYTTAKLTATASGGAKPYSYSWSADNGFTVNSPSSSSTTVSASGFNDVKSTVVTCTVTDDNSDTVQASARVTITFGNLLL